MRDARKIIEKGHVQLSIAFILFHYSRSGCELNLFNIELYARFIPDLNLSLWIFYTNTAVAKRSGNTKFDPNQIIPKPDFQVQFAIKPHALRHI